MFTPEFQCLFSEVQHLPVRYLLVPFFIHTKGEEGAQNHMWRSIIVGYTNSIHQSRDEIFVFSGGRRFQVPAMAPTIFVRHFEKKTNNVRKGSLLQNYQNEAFPSHSPTQISSSKSGRHLGRTTKSMRRRIDPTRHATDLSMPTRTLDRRHQKLEDEQSRRVRRGVPLGI